MSRVVMFGYGDLAVAGLSSLRALGADVAAVVVPGNRSGSDIECVRAEARRADVAVLTQPRAGEAAPFVRQLRDAGPDVLLTWSYSMVLTPEMLAVPKRPAVNIHGGLLPEYRGGHVMQWAILNGERESGATLHYMEASVDTGAIIDTVRFPLAPDDDAVTVREKLKTAGLALIDRWWARVSDGTAPAVPQDEGRARYWPLRAQADGLIDWTASSDHVGRLVRALTCNSPGAFTQAAGRVVSIRRVARVPRARSDAAPGSIIDADVTGLHVAAGDADVLITEAELDGHRMTGSALAEVRRLAGDRFGSPSRSAAPTTHA